MATITINEFLKLRKNKSITNETNNTANIKSNTTELTAAIVLSVLSSAIINFTPALVFCASMDLNLLRTNFETSTALASPCFFNMSPIPFLPLYRLIEVVSLMPSVTVATSFKYTGLPGSGMASCTFFISSTVVNFPVNLTELFSLSVCTLPAGKSSPERLTASTTCERDSLNSFNFPWFTLTCTSLSSPPKIVISATPFNCCICGRYSSFIF